jgi:hypothetical protein
MVKEILTKSGLPFKESRFLVPPKTTYAIYNDAIERRGGDTINLVSQHDVSIERYEYEPDPVKEKAIEALFDTYSIEYTKQPREWITSEQLYQVVYDFTYILKGGL